MAFSKKKYDMSLSFYCLMSCLYDTACLIDVTCFCLRILVSNTYYIVLCFCFVFRHLVYTMFPVFLDCPFLIVSSVFSNVYLRLEVIVGFVILEELLTTLNITVYIFCLGDRFWPTAMQIYQTSSNHLLFQDLISYNSRCY
jgi:hypothetical protein